jgi:hypothetical protein
MTRDLLSLVIGVISVCGFAGLLQLSTYMDRHC